ncbi:MAG: hypothetical protein HQ502_01000 [Alphaproteobacteria bacterium]|nr:hypothetical protein [Alphaproteobacteria bacterium]
MADLDSVSDFWAKGDPVARVHTGLKAAGFSLDALSIKELRPFDHFHARGLLATIDLDDRLNVAPGAHLLDIGYGVGGPARYMADRFDSPRSFVQVTALAANPRKTQGR